ncbi:MAG: DUF2281 domain-containing protein [Nostoc sp. CreGUA01]|nr:DUF2281 domain-containing protein [Nostoc sp. CreGUA01]
MDFLKAKILEKLERLPENAQQQVLDFVEFLEWRKDNLQESQLSEELDEESDTGWLETDLSNLGSYEPYDWQPGELEKGLPVKYIPEMGVVIVEQ